MSGLWVVSILLVIVILLLISIIFLNLKEDPSKSSNEESLKDIDKAMERQEINISDLTKDIQSFHDPLDKLKRYLSGGKISCIMASRDHSPNFPARVPPDRYLFSLSNGSWKD